MSYLRGQEANYAWHPVREHGHTGSGPGGLPAVQPAHFLFSDQPAGRQPLLHSEQALRRQGCEAKCRISAKISLRRCPAFSGVVGDSAEPGTYDWAGVGDRFESCRCLIWTDTRCIRNVFCGGGGCWPLGGSFIPCNDDFRWFSCSSMTRRLWELFSSAQLSLTNIQIIHDSTCFFCRTSVFSCVWGGVGILTPYWRYRLCCKDCLLIVYLIYKYVFQWTDKLP